MSIPFYYVKLRTGVEANRTSIIPLLGEPIYTTDTKMLYIGDGITPGGIALKAEPTNFSFEYSSYNLLLDDTENQDIEVTTWNQVLNVIKFSNVYNNSVWFNFSIPQFWRNNKDAFVEIQYILDTAEYSKIVKLDFSYYIAAESQTIDYNNPSYSSSFQILSDTSNVNVYSRKLIDVFKIHKTHLSNSDSILIIGKLKRDAESTTDNYSGGFLLSRIVIRQVE